MDGVQTMPVDTTELRFWSVGHISSIYRARQERKCRKSPLSLLKDSSKHNAVWGSDTIENFRGVIGDLCLGRYHKERTLSYPITKASNKIPVL